MLHMSIPYHHHAHAHTDFVPSDGYHHLSSSDVTPHHQHQHHALGMGEGYRHPSSAPLRKLTVDLIKTYRKINDVSENVYTYVSVCVCEYQYVRVCVYEFVGGLVNRVSMCVCVSVLCRVGAYTETVKVICCC